MKKKSIQGIYPTNHPKSVRDYIDQDYLGQLDAEAKEFLSWFNDCFYGADFRGDTEQLWSTEERRKRYRAKNFANTSAIPPWLYSSMDGVSLAQDDCDWRQTPEYLNSPEYKADLAAFRATLSWRDSNPEETPQHKSASKRMEKYRNGILEESPTPSDSEEE